MIKFIIGLVLVIALFYGWKLVSRTAYETAEYRLVEKEGNFEIRDYPELKVVSTKMKFSSQGNDGSFMRLFRYISGKNEGAKKIAMTTPVFMDPDEETHSGKMSFVLPKEYFDQNIPEPQSDIVEIESRPSGRYAVVRFSGWMNEKTSAEHESKLRQWLAEKGLKGAGDAETAGYDPPITPGPLRRNEVLIRLNNK